MAPHHAEVAVKAEPRAKTVLALIALDPIARLDLAPDLPRQNEAYGPLYGSDKADQRRKYHGEDAVSYTHLTLPTKA